MRHLALMITELANATAGIIRLKRGGIGAVLTVSVRCIKLAFAGACAVKAVFTLALQRLRRPPDIAVAA